MFKFEFTLNDEDYIAFNKHVAFNESFGKKQFKIYCVFVLVFTMIIAICASLIFQEFFFKLLIPIVAVVVLVIWCIFFAKSSYLKSIAKNVAKLKKLGKLPYEKQVSLTFNDDCFVESVPDAEGTGKYSKFEKVVKGESAVYIFMSAISAHIIPNNAFTDDVQKKEFIDFINSKIVSNEH